MKGSVVKKGNRFYAVFDLPPEVVADPETGRTKKKRRQRWVGGFDTEAEADRALTENVYKVHRGSYVEASKVTLGEWLDMWLEAHVKPPNTRPRTYETYESICRVHLKPALGSILLQKLTPADVRRYQLEKLETHHHHTVEYHHMVLHNALEVAASHEYGLIDRNPAHKVSVPVPEMEEEEDEPMTVWTPEEAKRFLEVAAGHGVQMHTLFSLMLETGARKGEALALKWEDVDFKAGTLTIRRTLLRVGKSGEPVFGPPKKPKNKKGSGKRVLELTEELLADLKRHKAHQAEVKMRYRQGAAPYQDHGLIFAREPEGWERPLLPGAPLDYAHFAERVLYPLIEEAGVTKIRVHDIRHTAATLMLLAGVPLKVVSERLGHAGIEITANRYSHVLPRQQKEAASKLRALLS